MTDATSVETRAGASQLMRAMGLAVDGPAQWSKPVRSRLPGVFVIELPPAPAEAPIDTLEVRRWLERVPALTLDGERPTPQDLGRRVGELWLPGEPILFIGRSPRAIGNRLAAIYATQLGDAKPTRAANLLHALSVLSDLRVWWAETEAHEEYEDALLAEVARRNEAPMPGSNAIPFANVSSSGANIAVRGLSHGLRLDPAAESGTQAKQKARAAKRTPARPRKTAVRNRVTRPVPEPNYLSQEGLDRLAAELGELRDTVRPEVIARVRSARELGDLKENGDYEYARKEQSFVEGRILALEQTLRTGVRAGCVTGNRCGPTGLHGRGPQ